MSFIKLLIPACMACLCNASANMLWKMRFDAKPLKFDSMLQLIEVLLNGKIVIGICLYGLSMLFFFYMLSNFKLSMIMPVTCLTYIFNMLIAYSVFNEKITGNQVAGTALIIAGLIVISQTKVQI